MRVINSPIQLTVFSSSEKNALMTTSRCPLNFFGSNPSSGFKVYSRAVISRDVVIKYLEDQLAV